MDLPKIDRGESVSTGDLPIAYSQPSTDYKCHYSNGNRKEECQPGPIQDAGSRMADSKENVELPFCKGGQKGKKDGYQ